MGESGRVCQSRYNHNLDHNFTAMGFTETWLRDNFSPLIHLNDYSLVENHRKAKKGGGVCLFIKNDVVYSCRNDISPFNDDIESIFVEINVPTLKQKVKVGVVYRPPSGDITSFNDQLHEYLK